MVVVQTSKRYVVEPVSNFEATERFRVWDREECKHIGGASDDKSAVEYLCSKLNGEFKKEEHKRF